jgi:hypothetical protein
LGSRVRGLGFKEASCFSGFRVLGFGFWVQG